MLAIRTLTPFSSSKPKIAERQFINCLIARESSPCLHFRGKVEYGTYQLKKRRTNKCLVAVEAVSSGLHDNHVSSSFEDFTVTTSTDENNDLKVTVEVSGSKTREIYNSVFSKMVADAQPIPGFRRVKGGKTPNIPEDILLEILGPEKVYKKVITKIINNTIAEYVSKERLAVGKDLHVEQSFEDLEAGFEPGDIFRFDAIVPRRESK